MSRHMWTWYDAVTLAMVAATGLGALIVGWVA